MKYRSRLWDAVRNIMFLAALPLIFLACTDQRPKYVIGVSQCSEDIWRNKLNEELKIGTYFHDGVELRFASADDSDANGRDELFAEAGRCIINSGKASIGYLQRMLKIGFNRAARIMDSLAEEGVVGAESGTKAREILMTIEEFESYLNSNQ